MSALPSAYFAVIAGATILCAGLAPAAEPASETVKLIEETLSRIEQDAKNAPAQLRELAQTVIAQEPANVVVAEQLTAALQKSADKQPAEQQAILTVALLGAKATLGFRPLREAKLPEGFPEPTPVGEIQVKQYPAYRLARTEMKTGQEGAFGLLFNHIKQNEIAMTAPVEMRYGTDPKEGLEGKSMAFLYGSTKIGETGEKGKVDVVDVPAMTTVSLGLRGDYTDQRIAEARQHLQAWLEEHADQYVADGDLRVMGYNSPFVPAAMRYAEIEIPIQTR